MLKLLEPTQPESVRPAKPGNAQGFALTNTGAYEAQCSRYIPMAAGNS